MVFAAIRRWADGSGRQVAARRAANVPPTEVLAVKRGWQTLLQGLAIDVVVAVALVVLATLPALDSWDTLRLQIGVISFTLAKSVVQAVVSWVVRRWFDQSGSSQPLPVLTSDTSPDDAQREH